MDPVRAAKRKGRSLTGVGVVVGVGVGSGGGGSDVGDVTTVGVGVTVGFGATVDVVETTINIKGYVSTWIVMRMPTLMTF